MAWQLLNRRYTIGTVDGSGDITPGAAQTGFLDFTALTAGNDTYVVAVQGANWSYMTVRKVGAILRPQTTHDSSSGSSITFDTGLPISVFSDLGKEHAVYVDANGDVQNADALYLTFAPEDLTALKTTPLPSSGKSVRYLRGIVAGDGKSAFYVWEPSETATGDDFNYVVSSLSATGRWVRQKPITEIAQVSADSDAYNSSLYAVSNDLRFKNSAGVVKKVPKVESHYQATFATYAAFKAAASSKWTNGDLIEIRGITNEGDIDAPLTGTWDASNTNTTNLDFQYLRPDDISGSNPGRLSFPVPVRGVKFADSDATPSVKASTVFICADTVPAAYTTFDDMRDGEKRIVFPGAQDATFTDSSTFNMGGADFVLSTTDAPVLFVKENGVIALIGGGISRALLASTSNGEGAALIGIEDSGAFFTSTTVEGALQELGAGGVYTVISAQSISSASTYTLFDAGTAGKYWEVIARHATNPDISARAFVTGDASSPDAEIAKETVDFLEFSWSGTDFLLGNTSGSSGAYNILIRELF